MLEISDLKAKKLPELQELAKDLKVPKFKSLKRRTIPNIKLNNKTCPTRLYAHAPINYCTNISLTHHNAIYNP
jgi:hypothetical protein